LFIVYFSLITLTLMAEWQERHPAHKKPSCTNPRGYITEQMEEEEPRKNLITQVHLDEIVVKHKSQ